MRLEKNSLILEVFPAGTLGCNCSVIYEKNTGEAIIVDPGDDAELVRNFVKKKKLRVTMLLHTHAHFDHIGASEVLSSEFSCPLVLHEKDFGLYKMLPFQASLFGLSCKEPKPADRKLQDEESFGLISGCDSSSKKMREFLKTIHTPGHTEGSCSFYSDFFEEPILLSGDTLFKGSVGRTDLPGGDHQTLIRSIKNRMLVLPDETLCIPGHGMTTTVFREKKDNPFL